MSQKFKDALRNAMLDAFETYIGTVPIIRCYTGSAPAAVTDAATGTKLFDITLPSDWMADASGGTKSMSGTWEDTSADNSGTPGYVRIYKSDGTTCVDQLSVTLTGGGGDITLDSMSLTAGQDVKITSFTETAGNG